MNKFFLLVLSTFFLTGCINHPAPITATDVELNRYMGTWYEIAAFPMFFERGCYCTKANYQLQTNNEVKVTNQCRRDNINNNWSIATGKAWVANPDDMSKLKVQFYWPIRANYWILYIDKDYQYAIVGSPNYDYLWILARKPTISSQTYEHLLSIVASKGYDSRHLKLTPQEKCSYEK